MYAFCYHFMKPNCGEKQNYVAGYIDIAKDFETRFCTYELEKPFPRRKNYWINQRRFWWENNDTICRIKAKNM